MLRSRTRRTITPLLGVSILVAAGAPGCFFDPDIDDVVSVIERAIAPAELEPETTVRAGRAIMSLARFVTGLVPDEDALAARELLRGVNELHVGVYSVHGAPRGETLRLPEALEERLDRERWRMIVRMRAADSQLWLLARASGKRMDGAYAIVLESDELVVVKLRGDLSHTIDIAVREAMRRNPDMFDPVRQASGT